MKLYGHGLKLEKVVFNFFKFLCYTYRNHPKNYSLWLVLPDEYV